MFHFQTYTRADKENLLTFRTGETRLGQCIRCCDEIAGEALESPEIKFVLLGLPEDVGVRANSGIGGADSAWIPFLKSFLNLQETPTLSGSQILLYGSLQKANVGDRAPDASLETLRKQTGLLDEVVFPVIQTIVRAGKIPVIIGGGHNNAFPILKGVSLAKEQPVHALNIDAHADFRAIEGRHSGNGFSYAFKEGYLKRYFALGLHEAYNSREMMLRLEDLPEAAYLYWEDIFLRKKMDWPAALQTAIRHVAGDYFGVEMDVDAIANALSSAATPVGLQPRDAMEALYQCGKNPWSVYLHIPEAISRREDGQVSVLTGKLLSYLVQAFLKGVRERE